MSSPCPFISRVLRLGPFLLGLGYLADVTGCNSARPGDSPGSGGSGSPASWNAGGSDWRCPPGPFVGSPVVPGSAPTRLAGVPPADGFNADGTATGNIEGIVWGGGALFLSEIGPPPNPPPSRILRVTLDGAATAAVSIAVLDSGTNGLALDGSGGLLGASHGAGAIVDFAAPTGGRADVVAIYDGARFDSPNDLARRRDGNIYFSDPSYQAPAPNPQSETRVYRVAPGAHDATVVDANRRQPNGVTLSLDEQTLFVDGSDGLFAYPVAADGSTSAGRKIGAFSGDGMVLDCAGDLFIASGSRVLIVDPTTGTQTDSIMVPGVLSVTNLAFGGADRTTLFITAQGTAAQQGVFALTMAFPGLPY